MQKVDVLAEQVAGSRAQAGRRREAGERSLVGRVRKAVEGLSDDRLALAVSTCLFVLAAWPLLLTSVPPYQDLPNHMAAVTVIRHPEVYPEFISNGFLKTNSALFFWLYAVGRWIGVAHAAQLFTVIVLALNAIVLPRFVLTVAGRRAMWTSAFFVWPMIHNWFVSMGMLDFALGVPLSLTLMLLAHGQKSKPSRARGVAIFLVSIATWYAHVFTLMIACLLLLIEWAQKSRGAERWQHLGRVAPWLLPAALLVSWSLVVHVTEPIGEMTGYVATGKLLATWELFYNMWAEWLYGFTWLSISSFVVAVLLPIVAFRRLRDDVPLFSPLAVGALAALYLFTPYIATNWFHVNTRFLPFIWLALLVRVPERLPKQLLAFLALAGVLYSVGMGVDFVRLDRDREEFTAATDVTPDQAKLLPLIFRAKGTSENTRSLLHAWGFYVAEKRTSAPLLFAHSRSFPVMYSAPPPPRFNHLVLESFAPSMGSPSWYCDVLRSGGVFESDCDGAWRAQWAEFWSEATPRYDHVLMWDAPEAVFELVPAQYELAYRRGRLTMYARRPGAVASRLPRARTTKLGVQRN